MGLVSSLQGQGDRDFTTVEIGKQYGVPSEAIMSKNYSVVSVAAKIPAGLTAGKTFDVVVAAMDNAKSLQGGTLLPTKLYAIDNAVYAIAEGTVEASDKPGVIGTVVGGATSQKCWSRR